VRHVHKDVGGTSDLAYYFLSAATSLVGTGGRVALVQPRAVLNATAALGIRSHLPEKLRPNLMYAPTRSDYFTGASVFISLVVLGPEAGCRVSRADAPSIEDWKEGVVANNNWWLAMDRVLADEEDAPEGDGPTVGETFEVMASMTTGEAYDLVPFVVDTQSGRAPKLVTTGLIDPETCLWGTVNCRYLKRDYQFPRVDGSSEMPNNLRKRVRRSARPKIVIAGLAKRIECFLDREGEYIGAVSTFSIFHPEDDQGALEDLCAELLEDSCTRRFTAELGGNAMGGGNITMKKSFLAGLPYKARVRR
jgi:hypothetical protein